MWRVNDASSALFCVLPRPCSPFPHPLIAVLFALFPLTAGWWLFLGLWGSHNLPRHYYTAQLRSRVRSACGLALQHGHTITRWSRDVWSRGGEPWRGCPCLLRWVRARAPVLHDESHGTPRDQSSASIESLVNPVQVGDASPQPFVADLHYHPTPRGVVLRFYREQSPIDTVTHLRYLVATFEPSVVPVGRYDVRRK